MPYIPSSPPRFEKQELRDFAQWIEEELLQIARTPDDITEVQFTELNAAPSKPRNGMVVYADGTNWNPGSGEGFYGRQAGAWVKL